MKIIFLGPPGSGKGTYASRIGVQLGIPQISTGDLFRAEIAAETPLGKTAAEYINKGQFVPDDITLDMVKARIAKPDCKNGLIFDGFPRTIPQADALKQMTKVDIVINLVLPDDILIEKISARRSCKKCGNIYNIAYIKREGIDMPPMLPKKEGMCDKCGGELVQREDEKPEVVKERLEVYKRQAAPLVDYYRKLGLLADISITSGPDIMAGRILDFIKRKFKFFMITFNGIDGAGTGTQIKLLSEYFSKNKIKHAVVKNYTKGPIGLLLKKIFRGKKDVPPVSQALLFAADRFDGVYKKVWPAFAKFKTVICDRYFETNLAYFPVRGVDLGFVENAEIKNPKPDLSIILDVPAEVALKRKQTQEQTEGGELLNILDKEKSAIQEKARQNFLKLAKDKNWVVVDANRPVEAIQEDIRKIVKEKLGL